MGETLHHATKAHERRSLQREKSVERDSTDSSDDDIHVGNVTTACQYLTPTTRAPREGATLIIVFAGSQPDAEGREQARFPRSAEEHIKSRVRGLLQDLKPQLVIGALAAGSDILIAEAARAEGIPFRALLPFDVDTFRATSVSVSGTRWEHRYDRLVAEAQVESLDEDVEDDAYVAHNGALLDTAARLAEEEGQRLWCLLVRPSPDPAVPESVTDDMALRAEGRGLLTLDLDPLAERKRTFVVMPYGLKFDPALKRDIDCDAVFKRVYRPLLEDLDLDWNRADLATDSGIIHVGMIDDLANSDVVIGDLTATNFNVAYELGMRHVFARKSTVLIHPKVTGYPSSNPPFDVGLIRAHGFERSLEITDEEAERAIRALKPAIEEATQRTGLDSPVHEWFDVDSIVPPFVQRSLQGEVRKELNLRNAVRVSLKTSDGDQMRRASELVTAADIDEPTRSALRIELAVGLLGEGEYSEALALLETAQPETGSPLHRLWLHRTVMALRRLGEGPNSAEYTEYLSRAEALLRLALELGYEDSESFGIWGGLLKRRILSGSLSTLEQAATFSLMTEYYGRGFRADPQAYTGLNYVMALRLQGLKTSLSSQDARLLNEALIVTKFLNDVDLRRNPSDAWALMTDAELRLHSALIHGTTLSDAGIAYARAASIVPNDVVRSARDQLRFLIASGDKPDILIPIVDVLTPEGDSDE
ncbi:tetratricopeptide repeat-containing protein [Curtobacterium flaccumfaciens]|uniref:tetratricopeptide repeat-containing protein n=1 Tax=Curtobacterium flaccumfaciens TaxID=2035 RepID=UPI001366803D|nr:tetratricopeptide repeat-containing protein [Curtobacterium flaccumfaciens]QHN62797.1 hypothetical protein GBG65_19730 [Curtobacterium flaccumfaciens pv. flaccumfaciens]